MLIDLLVGRMSTGTLQPQARPGGNMEEVPVGFTHAARVIPTAPEASRSAAAWTPNAQRPYEDGGRFVRVPLGPNVRFSLLGSPFFVGQGPP